MITSTLLLSLHITTSVTSIDSTPLTPATIPVHSLVTSCINYRYSLLFGLPHKSVNKPVQNSVIYIFTKTPPVSSHHTCSSATSLTPCQITNWNSWCWLSKSSTTLLPHTCQVSSILLHLPTLSDPPPPFSKLFLLSATASWEDRKTSVSLLPNLGTQILNCMVSSYNCFFIVSVFLWFWPL